MSKLIKEVKAIGTRSKGKSHWKTITTVGTDGKERVEHLIVSGDREAQQRLEEIFNSPGKFEIEYKKTDDDFWGIINATRLSNGAAETKTNGTHNNAGSLPSDNGNESALFYAVARVMSSMISAGTYKPASPGEAMDEFVSLVRILNDVKFKKDKENAQVAQ